MRFCNICLVGLMSLLLVVVVAGCFTGQAQGDDSAAAKEKAKGIPDRVAAPKTIRDVMWVWGTEGTAKPGEHTLATYVQADTVQKMALLGVPNITGCGSGLPKDDKEAWALTEKWQVAKRLVWEISTDDGFHKPPFSYAKTAARVRALTTKYPKVEGVLLDDMTSMSVNAGFKGEHILALREGLAADGQDIKVWGVVYTMNMRQKGKGIEGIINALDVINMWVWDSRGIPKIESDIAYLEDNYPDKPIVLGLYLHDYGGGMGRIPPALMKQQCETALKLAHEKRIIGMIFLTITNEPETMKWVADWIKQVGDQKIGSPAAK